MTQSEETAASVQQERSKIMYSINPASYSSVFVLPTEIADKHLRMAGKAQLKVLLWLYRNTTTPFEIGVVSRETGIPADEIDDAMLYWIQAGLVVKAGEAPVSQPSAPESDAPVSKAKASEFIKPEPPVAQVKKPDEKQNTEPVIVKPSVRDISRRLSESPEVATLFNEVQEVFGRTLGYDAQANLIILHDYHGLSAEAIIMLCSYAKTIGKQGAIAYIMQMGKSWADQGITDFEAASKKIARLEGTTAVWEEFRALAGLENPRPTAKQSELFELWTGDFGYTSEMIYYAYEITVEKKGKISYGYMNGILTSWHNSGFRTVSEVKAAAQEFTEGIREQKSQEKPAGRANLLDKNVKKPSYDIELAMQKSRRLDPSKTKKDA